MSTLDYDVVVVGGGIVGLASAFGLSRSDRRVALIDSQPGAGCSRAAAGMLAPSAESAPEHEVFTRQCVAALHEWTNFAMEIAEASGHPSSLESPGSLFIGVDGSDRHDIERYFAFAHRFGISAESVTRDSRADLFEGVTPRVSSARFAAAESFVSPDETLSSLKEALSHRGVKIIEDRVMSVDAPGTAVLTEARGATVRSAAAIIATGYQSVPLAVLDRFGAPLRPVRGVTLHLTGPVEGHPPMIRALINGRSVYIIRRSGGQVIVGATSDEDSLGVVDARAVRTLLSDAALVWPAIDDCQFVEARVGLRPVASDTQPFFLEGVNGRIAWSSGHFRHGYLWAPHSAARAAEFANKVVPCA